MALGGHRGGADRHGRALSRRGAHAALVREFLADAAAFRSIRGAKRTCICCATPSMCWHPRSAPLPRGSCCRCCCAKRTVSPQAALKLLDDASAAIQYNREILQSAIDHVQQGIAVFDKDLQLICWNRQFGEMLDLPPDVAGLARASTKSCASRPSAAISAPAPRAIVPTGSSATSSRTASFRERLPKLGIVVEVRANRMPDGGIVVTYTDITPSVEAAEALERANENLERRVKERTEELTRLNEELARAKSEADEANISKTRFLAAASHDILQPLNAARLYATSLVERKTAGARSQARAEHRCLARSGRGDPRRAARYLAPRHRRDEAGNIHFPHRRRLRPVECRVRAARARKRPRAHLRALLARRAHRPAAAAAAAAESRLERDQVHAERAACWSAAAAAASCFAIEIIDTGLGIPRRKQKIIFQEFQRLDQGARVARGLGLGLSIVERIARVLGHKIDASLRARQRLDVSRSMFRLSPRSAGRDIAVGPHCPSRRPRSRASSRSASTTNRKSLTAWRHCCPAGAAMS